MKNAIIEAARGVVARTAVALSLNLPAQPPLVLNPAPRDRAPGCQHRAGAKLARMATEGRVGIVKSR